MSVLTLHTVWSISVPVALVEALFPGRRGAPWPRWPALVPVALLYLAGAALIAVSTAASEDFVARPAELAVAAAVAAALVVLALIVPHGTTRGAPHGDVRAAAGGGRFRCWLAAAFLAGSAFFALYLLGIGERALHPALYVALVLALHAGFAVAVFRRDAPPFALAAGAVLTYCRAGVFVQRAQYGYSPVQAAAQVFLVAAALGLLVLAARQDRHTNVPSSATAP